MSDARDFGAVGDGRADDTQALQHALETGDGTLQLGRGVYRLTATLRVDLAQHGPIAIVGSYGTAKLLMAAPGPAIELIGTHQKSAGPDTFTPQVWARERMPTLAGFEIEGGHPDADGITLSGVMQPTLRGLLIREVQTAIRITGRGRNLLIDGCHIYHNRSIGVHLDAVNCHQVIISASHISYCRLGGVRVDGASEIRNLQITGCDIEYNDNRTHNVPNADAEPTAEIYLDARGGSIREGTIAGCTLQARDSENGANIRFLDDPAKQGRLAVGLWTISGNMLGNQRDNIHLTGAAGVSITGNVLYNGYRRNLLIEHSRNISIAGNNFGDINEEKVEQSRSGIRIVDSSDICISGIVLRDATAGRHAAPVNIDQARDGALELVRCARVNVSGSQFINPDPAGIFIEESRDTNINGCTILEDRPDPLMTAAIRWTGTADGNLIAACRLGTGTAGTVLAPDAVQRHANLEG